MSISKERWVATGDPRSGTEIYDDEGFEIDYEEVYGMTEAEIAEYTVYHGGQMPPRIQDPMRNTMNSSMPIVRKVKTIWGNAFEIYHPNTPNVETEPPLAIFYNEDFCQFILQKAFDLSPSGGIQVIAEAEAADDQKGEINEQF